MSPVQRRESKVIITGASDGIGKALAKAYARKGARLGLVARREPLLRELAELCRGLGSPQVEIEALDVTESGRFREGLRRLDQALGGADGFIANAGIDAPYPTTQDGAEEIRRIINVNVLAAIDGIELMKTLMLARGHGLLAGVTSIAAARGLPSAGPYCASKAALHAYLESLRTDLKPHGLTVSIVAPGFIRTSMTPKKMPTPFIMDAERAGEIFVRGLLRGTPLIIAPWQFKPAFWLLRALPGPIFRFLSDQSTRSVHAVR